jgi:hypothetical protein
MGIGFHDRTAELERLSAFVAELRAGTNRWLAVIGPRKVGKTSLILVPAVDAGQQRMRDLGRARAR